MSAEVLPFVAKAKNKAQVKAVCLWLIHGTDEEIPEGLDDPAYLLNLKNSMRGGILSPTIEKRIWEYAFGRPLDAADTDDSKSPIEALTDEELARELEKSAEALRGRGAKHTQRR